MQQGLGTGLGHLPPGALAVPGGMDDEDERMSPVMAVILLYGTLFIMLGAQTALFYWKKKDRKSYDLVTLMGLWTVPAIVSVQLRFWKFMLVWLLFTGVTAYVLKLCMKAKLDSTTPRLVYTWFLRVYQTSKAVGVVGYAMLLLEAFGMGMLWHMLLPPDTALCLTWYGVYFGVLGRDCAEVAADRMAATLSRNLGARINDCGVCGNELRDFSHLGEAPADEVTVQLDCKHCFHDLCIRGWTMVGKKDTCPVCAEKVDMRTLNADRPWETQNLTWIQMLDAVRYLVVWNPLIFMVVSVLFHLFAPHHHHHDHLGLLNGTNGTHLLNGTHHLAAALSPPALALGSGGAGSPSPIEVVAALLSPPPLAAA
ncbi:hypothetical protein FOA52_004501 [Chlamydomonas sp. UWO 241]|nr:hypothetical protein FOA52_004501 [Chlamydomonas sp. UWO 241]